ncbi:MAG TPA: hypothetical protein VN661_08120 [Candidatus Acidoferrales bacterium]|nr:hypothetical protein [Candidatus Acidoferrales bacterium]
MSGNLHFASRVALVAALAIAGWGATLAQGAVQNSAPSQQSTSATPASLPNGTKLVLKDGSFQLVREYHIDGNRVRYYSLDTHEWEEIPQALVDWDATKKVAAADAKAHAAALAEVKRQEEERNPQILDVDASVQVAPGVFLPGGDGLFVFDGTRVLPVEQAATTTNTSKTKMIEKVLVPVPIIPSRQSISIQGAHAKLRLMNGQPEFYLRTADKREPNIELLRTEIHGKTRHIANIDQLFDQQAASAHVMPLQRWQVAIGLYRFTLGQALPPGEYAIAELVPGEGLSLYVWDFAVDPNAADSAKK